jgi:hypothetical protein
MSEGQMKAGPGSTHDHGNCELCDDIQAQLDAARYVIGRKRLGQHLHGIDVCVYCAQGDLARRENAALRGQVGEAIEFVEAAGSASNSGEEYDPECQECEGKNNHHKKGCRINVWLSRTPADWQERGEAVNAVIDLAQRLIDLPHDEVIEIDEHGVVRADRADTEKKLRDALDRLKGKESPAPPNTPDTTPPPPPTSAA